MKQSDYWVLIHKNWIGDISEVEKIALQQWIAKDPRNQDTVTQLNQLLNAPWNEQVCEGPDKKQKQVIREKIMYRVHETSMNTSEAKRTNKYWPVRKLAAAASVIIAAFFFFYWQHKPYTITASQKQNLWLIDSTCITMCENTTVSLFRTSGERTVKMDGDAYFNLDSQKPLTITFDNGTMRCDQASFFLHHTQSEIELEILSGTLSLRLANKMFVLQGHQRYKVIPGKGEVSLSTNPNISSWYTGVWNFQNTRLSEIGLSIGKDFNTHFEFQDTALGNATFTGTFINEKLESILGQLSSTMGFDYALNNGVCYIKKPSI